MREEGVLWIGRIKSSEAHDFQVQCAKNVDGDVLVLLPRSAKADFGRIKWKN